MTAGCIFNDFIYLMADASEHPQPTKQPPEDAAREMTPGELAEAKRYGRLQLTCTLADRGLDIAYLAMMALVGGPWFDRWLARWPLLARYWSLRLVALFLIVVGLHTLLGLPLSVYSGYVLEHRFGLSRLTPGGWLWRNAKRLALTVTFGAAVFLGLFGIIWLAGPYWWLVGAAAFFVVSVVLGQLVPVLILPLFYTIERLDNPELLDRMSRLAEGTGLSIEGIYRMALSEETVKANAMLAGLGRTRRVLMGDTLLDHFTPEEIEVIFAHEVGHHVFHHVPKLIAAGLLYSAIAFWICDRLMAVWVTRVTGGFDYAETPHYVFALPLVMFLLSIFAMLVEPIQNAISRAYERQCDRYALHRTGRKAAYLSAFRKLSRLNKDDPDPPRLEVLLFHSHPPIAERLAMAEEQWAVGGNAPLDGASSRGA
jgi:STE24 endopeptidase